MAIVEKLFKNGNLLTHDTQDRSVFLAVRHYSSGKNYTQDTNLLLFWNSNSFEKYILHIIVILI